MQHETATVKKSVKKYTTVKGIKKESISFNINLGAKSGFNDGDDVAIIPIAEFNAITDADADEIIIANNEKIDKLNAELHDKTNLLDDLSVKFKAYEKTIDELESDISAKAEIINDCKIKIAEFNAVDIGKLTEKADKLDDLKDELIELNKKLDAKSNIISLLQNQIMEWQQLCNYQDKEIDAVKNQNLLYKLIGKDATVDIVRPTFYLIDSSGNPIKKDSDDISVDAEIGGVSDE